MLTIAGRVMLTIGLLLAACAFTQDVKPLVSVNTNPKTFSKCKIELATSEGSRSALLDTIAQNEALISKLTSDDYQLAAKTADLEKKLDEMRAAAIEVLKFNAKLQEEYFKSVQQQNETAEKYNDLLSSARQSIDSANDRLARQYRVNNALMMYSMMPKVQPYVLPQPVMPQLPIYQPPARIQTNCISSYTPGPGGGIYTTCN